MAEVTLTVEFEDLLWMSEISCGTVPWTSCLSSGHTGSSYLTENR